MPETAPPPVTRAPVRRPPGADPAPAVVIPAGDGVTVTVALPGPSGPKSVKNALERAVRVAGKAVAAGLDLTGFLAMVEAIAEAGRHEQAAKEAKARVHHLLAHTPAGRNPVSGPTAPTDSPPALAGASS